MDENILVPNFNHNWLIDLSFGFYDTSTTVGYLMANSVYAYIIFTPPLGQDMTQGHFLSGV